MKGTWKRFKGIMFLLDKISFHAILVEKRKTFIGTNCKLCEKGSEAYVD